MTKWQYIRAICNPGQEVDAANFYGEQGWEVIYVRQVVANQPSKLYTRQPPKQVMVLTMKRPTEIETVALDGSAVVCCIFTWPSMPDGLDSRLAPASMVGGPA